MKRVALLGLIAVLSNGCSVGDSAPAESAGSSPQATGSGPSSAPSPDGTIETTAAPSDLSDLTPRSYEHGDPQAQMLCAEADGEPTTFEAGIREAMHEAIRNLEFENRFYTNDRRRFRHFRAGGGGSTVHDGRVRVVLANKSWNQDLFGEICERAVEAAVPLASGVSYEIYVAKTAYQNMAICRSRPGDAMAFKRSMDPEVWDTFVARHRAAYASVEAQFPELIHRSYSDTDDEGTTFLFEAPEGSSQEELFELCAQIEPTIVEAVGAGPFILGIGSFDPTEGDE